VSSDKLAVVLAALAMALSCLTPVVREHRWWRAVLLFVAFVLFSGVGVLSLFVGTTTTAFEKWLGWGSFVLAAAVLVWLIRDWLLERRQLGARGRNGAAFRDNQERKRGSVPATPAPPPVDPRLLERLIRRTWWKQPEMREKLLDVREGVEILLDKTAFELERQGAIRILSPRPYPGRDFWRDDEIAACDLTEEAERIVGAILREEEKAT
jgi:hypothetical protein